MRKKIAFIILVVTLIIPFYGCWDYRGIDQISIVAGMAIDKNSASNQYEVSMEILDLTSSPNSSSIESKLITSSGATLYDALWNTSKQMNARIYMGNMEILVISNQLASSESIDTILECLFRDIETRSTINILVSTDKDAKSIITPQKEEKVIVSYQISNNLAHEKDNTKSTNDNHMFVLYKQLKRDVKDYVITSINHKEESEKKALEFNGLAVFKNGLLKSYIDKKTAQYYLYITSNINDGDLTFALNDQQPSNTSLIIDKKDNNISYSFDNNQFTFYLDFDILASLRESKDNLNLSNDEFTTLLETRSAAVLKENIEALIKDMQNQKADIFNFNQVVYKQDPVLWSQVKNNWDDYFSTAKIVVSPQVTINDFGLLKKS